MLSIQTQSNPDLVKCEGGWRLVETGFSCENNRRYEGLFTLGSGYLHLRGSLEEHLLDAPQNVEYMRMPANVTAEEFPKTKAKWGTYVPGIYGKHPFLGNELINLPSFIGMRLAFAGNAVDLESSTISHFERILDLRSALLSHSYKWKPQGQNAQIDVTYERFVSVVRKSVVVQRLSLIADRDVLVDLESWIDGDVRTNGFDHFKELVFNAAENTGDLNCRVHTDLEDQVLIGSRHSISKEWVAKNEDRAARAFNSFELKAGIPFVLEKRTCVSTSRDGSQRLPVHILDEIAPLTYEQLFDEHKAEWEARWEKSDVQVEGDLDSQTALRASIYHLLRAQVDGDRRVAIDAKGYAGEGYFGRFFWDTEMYLHPFFAYTDIERARELAEFRIETLSGAKENAERFQYRGARFAWESDAKGDEWCMLWQYRDHEVHITADVVYALAHQAQASAQDLSAEAKTVILEAARYWESRIDWLAEPGKDEKRPNLLGVMGPDEYSPLSANNAYTNRLVRFTFDLAARHGITVGATADECLHFSKLANLLPIPRRADGLVLQSEHFESLADPDFDKHWLDRKRPYAAQVCQERLYRSKNLKQADVLMLMFLFPQEFSDAEIELAWRFYLPVTTHDSSLSAGIHSIIASRLGHKDEAWKFWLKSAFLDLDLTGEAAAEGVHIAGNGANWLVAVCGFAGFRYATQTELFSLHPRLPEQWKRLAFPINWKGQQIFVDITHEKATVYNASANALDFYLGGRKQRLLAGAKEDYALRRDRPELKGVIFDLDGVITDTAEYHYQAWQAIADELGIEFNREINHRLRGVGRMESLEIILERSSRTYSQAEKEELATKKNALYNKLIEKITPADLLPGIENLLQQLKKNGIKMALASSSKNAPTILKRLNLENVFDFSVDPSLCKRTKPDPEIFLRAAAGLDLDIIDCLGIEDAPAGIAAIKAAGMCAVGIGEAGKEPGITFGAEGTEALTLETLVSAFEAHAFTAARMQP